MLLRACSLLASTLLVGLSLSAADGDGVHVTVVGTVSAVIADKKTFTLTEDVGGKAESYRPFYAGGDPGKMAGKIPTLTVGEHVQVEYTVKEGRRAIAITDVPK